jgi:DNA-directed RNA polymerase subunit RPC12/RpoP
MGWRIKFTNIRQPMLSSKHILASMIYFDSDMSKSTNTVVYIMYFDWKTVIYIYVCGKCRTQFMLPMEKSVKFTCTCANKVIPSIIRSFVYKAKEYVTIHCKMDYLKAPYKR